MKGSVGTPLKPPVQSYFSYMHSPTKPWYFSTTAIVRLAEKAVNTLPTNRTDFDQALFGIDALSKLIKTRTENGALMINLEESQQLIHQLETIRSKQLQQRNDGRDDLRKSLATTIQELIVQVAEQQQLASDYLCQKSVEAQEVEDQSTPASAHATPPAATSWVGESFILPLLSAIQSQFPGPYERGIAIVDAGKRCTNAWLSPLTSTSAQPFAASVMARTALVAVAAVERAQPYLNKATPLLRPAVARLQRLHAALAANPTLGPYVLYATDRARALLSLSYLSQLGLPGLDVETGDLSGVVGDISEALPTPALTAVTEPPHMSAHPVVPTSAQPAPPVPVALQREPAAVRVPSVPTPAATPGKPPAKRNSADRTADLPSAPPPSPA